MRTDNAIIQGTLTKANIDFYKEQGYLIGPDTFSSENMLQLKNEATAIVSGKRGAVEGAQENSDDLSEDEVLKRYAAIHFPHKISPMIKETASDKKVAGVLSKIVSPNVKCLQTMLFMKAPGKKGQAWHQDEYFIPTRDKSLIGVWLALEDADFENGCLWVIPGSHKDGYIRKRIENTNTEFADLERAYLEPYKEEDYKMVEVKAGSVIYFHGYLLHMSLKNKSDSRFRRALVSHYSSAETMLPWDQDGRLDFTHDLRDVFMVAGQDPYAHKGIEDVSKPFVRPDVLDFRKDNQ